MKISVIIPTLNEADHIQDALRHLRQIDENLELIVSDCHSTDGTAELADSLATVVSSSRGRGIQMNTGAAAATGDVLWFIHADCRPHIRSADAIRNVLADANVVGGAFEYTLNASGLFFRLAEWTSNVKNRLLFWFFGDMGIFVRKTIFEEMRGYAEIPLMEDMEFCQRLKQYGKIVILPYRISTSTRRWYEEGLVYNVLRNWTLQLLFLCGFPPSSLTRWYLFR